MNELSSPYSIGRYLIYTIQSSGKPLNELMKQIGYEESDKGIRDLHLWLETGQGDSALIHRMVKAGLLTSVDEFEEALFLTNEQKFIEKCNRESRLRPQE